VVVERIGGLLAVAGQLGQAGGAGVQYGMPSSGELWT